MAKAPINTHGTVVDDDVVEGPPLIQQLGMYMPRIREGKSDSRREIRNMESSAKELYRQRLSFARGLLNNKDKLESDGIRAVCSAALVQECHDLSIGSFYGLEGWVKTLMEKEGGEVMFFSMLQSSMNRINAERSKHAKAVFVAAIVCVISITAFVSMTFFTTNSIIQGIVGALAATPALVALARTESTWGKVKKAIEAECGPNRISKNQLEKFTKVEDVLLGGYEPEWSRDKSQQL